MNHNQISGTRAKRAAAPLILFAFAALCAYPRKLHSDQPQRRRDFFIRAKGAFAILPLRIGHSYAVKNPLAADERINEACLERGFQAPGILIRLWTERAAASGVHQRFKIEASVCSPKETKRQAHLARL
jgi:hypothetical protein